MRLPCLSFLAAILLAAPALAQMPYPQGSSRYEAAGEFDYLLTSLVDKSSFNMPGFSGTFAYNAYYGVAAVADVGYFSTNNILNNGETLKLTTAMAGPRLALRGGRFTPFAQGLVGLGRGSSNVALANSSGWAGSFGGGIDLPIHSTIALRVEVSDVLTHIKNGENNQQNSVRISTGIVYGFGSAR
jgi:hypothetical protein